MKTERGEHQMANPKAVRSPAHSGEPFSRSEKLGRTDAASLRSKAREAARIMDAVQKVPEVREELVLKIREAIESGTYDVKGSDVAEKLIKESIVDSIL